MIYKLLFLFILPLSCLINNDTNIDYFHESYFAIIGTTGEGKSEFLNALCGKKICETSAKSKSKTKNNQLVIFNYNNHLFKAIDTPGLDDSDSSKDAEDNINNLLKIYPKINTLIIIKKYCTYRLSESLQKQIEVYMKAFPLKNFWEHVIVINTFSNPNNDDFKDFLVENGEKFEEKINNSNNLVEIMKKMNIDLPNNLPEFYVDSKYYNKYPEIKKTLIQIKNKIQSNKYMFKEVIYGGIKSETKESKKNKGFYIVKEFETMKLIDFDDSEIYIEKIIKEKEIAPEDCPIEKTEEEYEFFKFNWISVFKRDFFHNWLNVLVMDKIIKYKVYKINTYIVGNITVRGDRIFDRIEYTSLLEEGVIKFLDQIFPKEFTTFVKKILLSRVKFGMYNNFFNSDL